MLSGETTNTNFIVFGLTQPGLEPTIYCTQGEHANQYATNAINVIGDYMLLGFVVSSSTKKVPHI
jgi:hypothetical protein